MITKKKEKWEKEMQSLKKTILDVENDLEILDMALESCMATLDLHRMANENSESGNDEQNALAYEGLRLNIEMLRERFLEKSFRTLLNLHLTDSVELIKTTGIDDDKIAKCSENLESK